jgi:hypothetical protein
MKKLALIFAMLLFLTNVYSRRNMDGNKGDGNKGGDDPTPTAGCASAVALSVLQLNNVRTRIEGTGGSMWQDRANGIADYEVPKRSSNDDPKFTSIFAGALWMGGQDVNGQLKLAAVRFRQSGNDFWPGPLNTSTAEINAATCSQYDKFYGVSRAMIDLFNAWYNCTKDPSCIENDEYPGYTIPSEILNWPAHGDISLGQDWHLAPFFDRDGDDFYDPNQGDYPKYDLLGEIDCRNQRDVRLFGDTTIWFVFNDKGNTHSESNGPSIGMEIRGQAFAFATNDEVNNMTFYNYEMINRSTFTLTETYFGQWVDADLGGFPDDYVGCDAERGLGYCYNGDAVDDNANGITGYGTTPPAVGIDFFEGPYADDDGQDNPLVYDAAQALAGNGIPYPGLGIGYGDGIVDNERYGMRKFVYYSNPGAFAGDGPPSSALNHYNYLRGIWKDGSNMVWGGNGHFSGGGNINADIMFPGNSDPLFWSTKGVAASPTDWSEFNEGNPPSDRRFLQSAGPFTLEPGAVNDLTIGVVWARAVSGDNWASVEKLRVADDKAQALFDNCFKIADGPQAPDVTFQELDRELILYLTNRSFSNNANETYNVKNPFIAIPDTLDGVYYPTDADKDTLKFYKFQGYQIYQVKNGLVSIGEIDDPNKSRLAAQVDIKDGVSQLVNYTYDENLLANIPKEMVFGEDKGIKHSFRFQNDLFATGDARLINHKTYYYMAVAYGYNEFKHYNPLDPLGLDGQLKPYIGSRNMAGGQALRSFSAIPHNPAPENGGTIANSSYGDMPQITRLEGQGNGGNDLELTAESEAIIVGNYAMDHPVYKSGKGPIQVQVIDPLRVRSGFYQVQFKDTTVGTLNDAYWTLHTPSGDSINADQLINVENEQLILNHGLSVTIKQVVNPGINNEVGESNGVIGSSVEYGDSTLRWLGGFTDTEGENDGNWIRSGNSDFNGAVTSVFNDILPGGFKDPDQSFENLIRGTWAPYALVSYYKAASIGGVIMQDAVGLPLFNGSSVRTAILQDLASVDIVFTTNRDQWSRAMVLEARNDTFLSEGAAPHIELRRSPSVDKQGRASADAGYNAAEGNLVSTTGMGWFPGYAINVETGELLNIAFAEDSWLAGENGRDMMWNPTDKVVAGVNNELMMGGKHYVYVFNKTIDINGDPVYPNYDEGASGHAIMAATTPTQAIANINKMQFFKKSCIWAGIPILNPGRSLFETTAKVKLRVDKPYENYTTASTVNAGLPYYKFDMTGMEVDTGNTSAMDSVLALINVVPNPYYAYSAYETGQLDNRIKLTNLPEECVVSIYNIGGTLMRRFQKSDPKTSLDWNLKNHVDVPVASGVYLIHVEVPGIGERTLKWYGVMKPTDLNGF